MSEHPADSRTVDRRGLVSPHRWSRIKEVFELAEAVLGAERDRILDRECGSDTKLRREVESLLGVGPVDAVRTAGAALAAAEAVVLGAEEIREGPGTAIGAYTLLELIGEGAFGKVFLAEQHTPVRRRVAIKIVKPGMDSREVISRFEAERQALAVMDHPNVAKVFDGGVTSSGRPYFVMEFVAGLPLTAFCDRHRLSVRQRLELFIPVCEAVQHAHHKGIIHRDLKPSNVLVLPGDTPIAAATPKVIDFGIAKAISPELSPGEPSAGSRQTVEGQVIGTPEYMSPEQAGGSQDIDTRTDVYSLGTLLYELLTGMLPFNPRTLRAAGMAEIQRILREVDPPRPSTRLGQARETATSVAASRSSEPRRLGTTIRGELDWIVMKAIEKERGRRYESAHALAQDLRSYLNGDPVLAAPPGGTYLLAKFARRHRIVVLAGTAITLALAVGLGVALWQASVARGERDRAVKAESRLQAERDLAQREHDRSQKVTDLVVSALQSQDPNSEGRQDILVSQAMQQAIKQLNTGELKSHPEVSNLLLRTIAIILDGNGRSIEAEPLADQALQLARQMSAADSTDTAASLDVLGRVKLSLGRFEDAEPLFRASLDMYRRLISGDDATVATEMNNLGATVQELGRAAEAQLLYQQALEMRRRLFKGDHPDLAESLNNLAFSLVDQNKAAEAEPLFVQSLEMYQRLSSGDEPRVAQCLNNVAYIKQTLGKPAEAEPLLAQSLEMARRLFKGDHPKVAQALNNLAVVRNEAGGPALAEPLYREALEMRQRLYKGDHPAIVNSLTNLAAVQLDLDRLPEAEGLNAQALEMGRRLSPADNATLATSLSNLARVRQALGRTAEARPLYDEGVAMLRRMSPEGSALLARLLWRSGSARIEEHDLAHALPELEEAVAIAGRLLPPEHPQAKEYREALERCRGLMGR